MDYYIQDFTESNYRKLIQVAKNVNSVTTYEAANPTGIVLRHDIDYSLNRAVALSAIEKEEKVPSYYFVHLHNDFYNAMDYVALACIRQLIDNDRIVGLHFDPCYYGLSVSQIKELELKVVKEKVILEDISGKEVTHMSFHNPDVGGEWHKLQMDIIGGLVNVYGPEISSSFDYCSDSNGYWRFQRLEDVLKSSEGKRVQVLTHPGWWQKEILYPFERIKRCVTGRAESVLKNYEDSLQKHGRLNVKK